MLNDTALLELLLAEEHVMDVVRYITSLLQSLIRTNSDYTMYARHDVIIESACLWLEDLSSIDCAVDSSGVSVHQAVYLALLVAKCTSRFVISSAWAVILSAISIPSYYLGRPCHACNNPCVMYQLINMDTDSDPKRYCNVRDYVTGRRAGE